MTGLSAPAPAPASPSVYLGEAAAEAANRGAAETDAGSLLTQLVLPAGSSYSATQPQGSSQYLSRPPEVPGTPKLIDLAAWWLVAGSPATVLESIKKNPPAGSRFFGEVSLGQVGLGDLSHSLVFSWPSIPGVLSSRELLVTAVAEPNGMTGLRVDAQVIWLVPRPVSERIPQRARVLEVAYSGGKARPQKFTVFNHRAARRIATLIDGLQIVQPSDPHGCPFMQSNPRTVDLTFTAAPSGRVLAEATQDVPPGVCSSMGLEIRGTPQPSLTGGGPVLRALTNLRPSN